MIKRNCKTEELDKKLQEEGKISYLDEPQHIEAVLKMNEEMDEVVRDFKYKDGKSRISAGDIIVR